MLETLTPLPGYVLVELGEELQFVETPDKPYSTSTNGIVVKTPPANTKPYRGTITNKTLNAPIDFRFDTLLGKKVFFEEYKDGTQTEIDGKKYAFIKLEDLRGYDQAKSTD